MNETSLFVCHNHTKFLKYFFEYLLETRMVLKVSMDTTRGSVDRQFF